MPSQANATLIPGASLHRIAEIVRHAILLGPDAWEGGATPQNNPNASGVPNLLPTDRDVVELFTLLNERGISYLLVGGIAMLRYVEGRNTEDVDLLMSLPSVEQLPELKIEEQSEFFIRGYFRSVRVDILLTANAVFAEVQQHFGAQHRFAELDVPTATPEGLILLKLYALPSLYRQGLFDRVSVYESDLASLIQRYQREVDPLLQRLQPHLEAGDLHELRVIVRDILARIARFEQFNKH
jgi:predicted nucleotidyltransferase